MINDNDFRVLTFSSIGFLQNHLINFPTYLNVAISLLTIVYLLQKIYINVKKKK